MYCLTTNTSELSNTSNNENFDTITCVLRLKKNSCAVAQELHEVLVNRLLDADSQVILNAVVLTSTNTCSLDVQ